ncbi:sugar ABC transporter ATP-binding protein [soil metagenome]
MAQTSVNQVPLLEIEKATKRFGGVTALDDVSFDLLSGEIHALLGENGAGKSTLIKILAGIHVPDSGTIRIDGETATIRSVADADHYGIRSIHQELSLTPNLSIAENIFLGREPSRFGWLNRQQIYEQAELLVASLGLDEIKRVRTLVSELSVAHRQLVEIARALSSQARILILDEPTASLSEAETEALFVTLRRLRSAGVGIIYISHRLEEIIRLADRITVLRDGHSIGTQPVSQVNQRELVNWMVGRDIADYFHRPTHRPGAVALEIRGLQNGSINGVSLKLHYGEILGLAGLVGSGRSELAHAIFGIHPIEAGEILVDGIATTVDSARAAIDAGIVLVPEDRRKEGLVMTRSLAFNLALPWTDRWHNWGMSDEQERLKIVNRAINSFRIKATHPEQNIGSLSGGNQQKALVGRWMEVRPKVLILNEPTRGVDVGAREEMFRIISSLVEEGMAVLLISSDLTEVMGMSHRIALYRNGQIIHTTMADAITPSAVMAHLTGAEVHADN